MKEKKKRKKKKGLHAARKFCKHHSFIYHPPLYFFKPILNSGAIDIQYSSNSSKMIFSISFKPLFHTIHHLQENTIKTGVYE